VRRVQQDPTRRRRTAPAVLGLGIAALLTVAACGSGQLAQTSGMPPAVDGGSGQAGKIAVRNAQIAFPESGRSYPAGSDVPLVVTIVNSGPTPDTLVSVTSPISKPAALTGSLDLLPGTALVAGKDLTNRPSATAAPVTTTTESSSATTTTTTGAPTSGSSSSAPTTTTTVATTTSAQPVVGQVSIILKQVSAPVQPGQSVRVTFTFAGSGSVTVDMPVAVPGGSPAE
jgi:copper(I)-binding protein